MKVNMTAALTKTIFFPFSRHSFLSSYRMSAYRHHEAVLVFSYGECNCLQALASSKTLHVQTNHAATSFFFSLQLRQLDGDTDVLFLQIK